jgi:FkbM family methyltransferase
MSPQRSSSAAEASLPDAPRPEGPGEPGPMSDYLAPPRGSRVSTDELLREVEEYFTLGAVVSPGDTVIDVGANVGAFALRTAQLCKGDVTLLCFEPSPGTFEALRSSFELNPVLRRTRHSIHQLGLTSHDQSGRELPFYHFRRFPTNSTLDLAAKRREFEIFFEDRARRVEEKLGKVAGWPIARLISALPKGPVGRYFSDRVMGLEEVKVKLSTLDEVIAKHKIGTVNLLKIDVEGHELDVLRGLSPASWPKIRQVVLETHDRDGREGKMRALLAENGLTKIHTTPQKTVDNGLESNVVLAARPT